MVGFQTIFIVGVLALRWDILAVNRGDTNVARRGYLEDIPEAGRAVNSSASPDGSIELVVPVVRSTKPTYCAFAPWPFSIQSSSHSKVATKPKMKLSFLTVRLSI